jgi:hypothetical protein
MNINNINIAEIVEQTKAQFEEDKALAPERKILIELILIVTVKLVSKLGLYRT